VTGKDWACAAAIARPVAAERTSARRDMDHRLRGGHFSIQKVTIIVMYKMMTRILRLFSAW
jgi:hypothetical protein